MGIVKGATRSLVYSLPAFVRFGVKRFGVTGCLGFRDSGV